MATDIAVLIGYDAGLSEYLDELKLVAAEENGAVDIDRNPRMSELPSPFRMPLFATDHRRAADARFFRGRGLLPTEWPAGLFREPRTFDLPRWLPQAPDWEPTTDLWVATPVAAPTRWQCRQPQPAATRPRSQPRQRPSRGSPHLP